MSPTDAFEEEGLPAYWEDTTEASREFFEWLMQSGFPRMGTQLLYRMGRIEKQAVVAERDRVRAFIKWDNPMMTDPAAVKAVGEYRAMLLEDLDRGAVRPEEPPEPS